VLRQWRLAVVRLRALSLDLSRSFTARRRLLAWARLARRSRGMRALAVVLMLVSEAGVFFLFSGWQIGRFRGLLYWPDDHL
jgi:hypothetical protein